MAKSKNNKRKTTTAPTNGASPAKGQSQSLPTPTVQVNGTAPASHNWVPSMHDHASPLLHPSLDYSTATFLDEYVRTAAFIPSRIGDSEDLVYLTQREVALAKLDILGKHIVEKMPEFEQSRSRGQMAEEQYLKFKEMEKAYRAKMAASDLPSPGSNSLPKDTKGKGKSTSLPFPHYGHPKPGWIPTDSQMSSPALTAYPDTSGLAELIAYAIRPPPGWKDLDEAHVESPNYRPYAYSADYVALCMIKKMPFYVQMMKKGSITQAQLDQIKAITREHSLKVLARQARTQASGVDEATQQLANLALSPSPGGTDSDGPPAGKGKRKGAGGK